MPKTNSRNLASFFSNLFTLKASDTNLYIEKGRHLNITLDHRICILYSDVENYFHFVIECSELETVRAKRYRDITYAVLSFRSLFKHNKFRFVLSFMNFDRESC